MSVFDYVFVCFLL